jgi:uncharacterized protein
MVYTEIKSRNKKKYYYRVISLRNNDKVSKKRIYLGVNLSKKNLLVKENLADYKLNIINKKSGLDNIKPKIIEILKKNKIKKAGIFGSYARGEETKKSDIDILIEPTPHMGFEFFGLKVDLEEKLKKKVDLVTYNSINKYLKDNILKDEIRII